MGASAREVAELVGRAHRECWSVVLASTVRLTRDLDLAEDCAQEAFVRALRTWPDGIPDNPAGWLTTVARRLALDGLRRETTLRRKLPLLIEEPAGADDEDQPTDPLRLVFTCCHPALARDSQVALTLRLICGLTTREVAAGLLISEPTAAARITRAKKKIATAGIPYRIPADDELAARLDVVLTVVQLVYTAGHVAAGPELTRADLTGRAIELARMLVRLIPTEPEPLALLGLLLMTQARGDARLSDDGELVLLADQDRSRWDARLLGEGVKRATVALRRAETPGRFALQAAVAGLHVTAPSWERTDWVQVVRMYDAMLLSWPSPIVALNRAAAQSLVPGADLPAVLAELDALGKEPALRSYAYLPATRADVLARLGRAREAAAAYDEAVALTANGAEQRFLARRRAALPVAAPGR
ncbi:putative RNA polymerase, sigma-24 subunit, ECF subfamily [Kribbella flavida DSM 17836]|uniref:Putative RNA polymerase, sigma-24 subunit, ECF subfamily n=1 Tax=Kribbella flavida (strain DSM 17836 / JCM 10339 / NBRC 14399) TaxID=479435 RepID=D2Q228_KRIFD|nr:sigma-70 family RNA polymerase sigma factor [Kribbella flavida]ADB33974.1 putative RNA polymerase, sigma-24 subunit, ECF subfamily [Kribbella flavida DSM 17836]